ncbi:MAG: hypothetical protein Q7T11_08480, partial [Deltaproteobacteria bacterium]|nr:hypothetical protein [Deltaproteobacteria bacterium]
PDETQYQMGHYLPRQDEEVVWRLIRDFLNTMDRPGLIDRAEEQFRVFRQKLASVKETEFPFDEASLTSWLKNEQQEGRIPDQLILKAKEMILKGAESEPPIEAWTEMLAALSPRDRALVYRSAFFYFTEKKGFLKGRRVALELAYIRTFGKVTYQPNGGKMIPLRDRDGQAFTPDVVRLQTIFREGVYSQGDIALACRFMAAIDPDGAGLVIEEARKRNIQFRFFPRYEPSPMRMAFYGLGRHRTIYIQQETSLPRLLMEVARSIHEQPGTYPLPQLPDKPPMTFARQAALITSHERRQDLESAQIAASWAEKLWNDSWSLPLGRLLLRNALDVEYFIRHPSERSDRRMETFIPQYQRLLHMRALALSFFSTLGIDPNELRLMEMETDGAKKILAEKMPGREEAVDSFFETLQTLMRPEKERFSAQLRQGCERMEPLLTAAAAPALTAGSPVKPKPKERLSPVSRPVSRLALLRQERGRADQLRSGIRKAVR